MSPTVVAIVAAVASLLAAVVSAAIARRSAIRVERIRQQAAAELEEIKARHAAELAERERTARAAEIVRAYQNPVSRAAYDLQSRIYNLHQGFRDPAGDQDYFVSNTLYVIAEFFGWMEIVRREMQFLDLGEEAETATLKQRLDRVQGTLASTSRRRRDGFYVYRGQQRAIGELMIVDLAEPTRSGVRSTCLGYAAFVEKLRDPSFAQWFDRLRGRLENLTGPDIARLVEVQHALVDLIDGFDPNHVRFGSNRGKIPTAF